jgi:hypothetical protein
MSLSAPTIDNVMILRSPMKKWEVSFSFVAFALPDPPLPINVEKVTDVLGRVWDIALTAHSRTGFMGEYRMVTMKEHRTASGAKDAVFEELSEIVGRSHIDELPLFYDFEVKPYDEEKWDRSWQARVREVEQSPNVIRIYPDTPAP